MTLAQVEKVTPRPPSAVAEVPAEPKSPESDRSESGRWSDERGALRVRTRQLLQTASRAEGPYRAAALEEVITLNIEVADSIASRYFGRGIPLEDLVQVARLALVRAVHNYSVDRGTDLLDYAVPSIRGAVKRHFRDCGWVVRPPRRVQEAHPVVAAARAHFAQAAGRQPTTREVADETGLDEETVIEVVAAGSCFSPDSLDRALDPASETPPLAQLGREEPAFEHFEHRAVLGPLLESLSDRDQRIVHLRFVEGLTQAQIGEELGVSQMQVSRLLSRILRQLREGLDDSDERAPAAAAG